MFPLWIILAMFQTCLTWWYLCYSCLSIHFPENDIISFFLWLNKILLYLYTTFSLSIHPQWLSSLIPWLYCCEYCCCKYQCADVYCIVFLFSRNTPRSGTAGSQASSIFSFLRKVHIDSSSGHANLQSQ
jgi:hypothetical protein